MRKRIIKLTKPHEVFMTPVNANTTSFSSIQSRIVWLQEQKIAQVNLYHKTENSIFELQKEETPQGVHIQHLKNEVLIIIQKIDILNKEILTLTELDRKELSAAFQSLNLQSRIEQKEEE